MYAIVKEEKHPLQKVDAGGLLGSYEPKPILLADRIGFFISSCSSYRESSETLHIKCAFLIIIVFRILSISH